MTDEARLSTASPREFRVTVLLSAEEYVALTHLVERTGLSQSAFFRMLLKARIEQEAHDASSSRSPDSD